MDSAGDSAAVDAGKDVNGAGPPHGARREELIVDLWARGLSYRAIGRELGIGERPTAGLISRLRAQGWDLPPRR